MNDLFSRTSRIIITCNKRLTPFLQQEVEAMAFTPDEVFATGIVLKGTLKDCIELNLNLRCASQVLFSLQSFRAVHPDDVYEKVIRMPWETWLPRDGYFSVTSNVDQFTVNNTMFLNVKVKDGIADRFRREVGVRPNSGSELDRAVVHIYWKDDEAEIFMDTSGPTLAKHGYRKIPGKAPMLEALATATVMASGWDQTSPFVNPMCGSGTLAIEAALLATHRKPGLYRNNYSFMHWLGYEKSMYESALAAIQRQVKEVPVTIIASDLVQDAIDISKVNAAAAGVEKMIQFQRCDFASTAVPQTPGVVFLNPEYGERLGDLTALEETYARIGDFLKQRCQGYTGFVFTGNLELAKKIGLKASRRIEFYNAKIDCRLLKYELYTGTKRERPETTAA
jgi:putative N6-adenine-specific DNA methylase